ncbi:hypothetical protein [Methylogaea oryzae]|uniref:Ribosome modulation factor n=1 Tax=Methylogaea oryzae TaxID=1295382 RepID=A0A8D4VUB5_9GAMM|nr:hypothetical protein [Methylogaea oryzae]BBL72792.1 hypothetical protein MoryE10_33980 [Methylogaea oryzae]
MKKPAFSHDWINDWPSGWCQRSLPYRQGHQAGYDWVQAGKIAGTLQKCPYVEGSVEMDAWFAGMEAGKDRGIHDQLAA